MKDKYNHVEEKAIRYCTMLPTPERRFLGGADCINGGINASPGDDLWPITPNRSALRQPSVQAYNTRLSQQTKRRCHG